MLKRFETKQILALQAQQPHSARDQYIKLLWKKGLFFNKSFELTSIEVIFK